MDNSIPVLYVTSCVHVEMSCVKRRKVVSDRLRLMPLTWLWANTMMEGGGDEEGCGTAESFSKQDGRRLIFAEQLRARSPFLRTTCPGLNHAPHA